MQINLKYSLKFDYYYYYIYIILYVVADSIMHNESRFKILRLVTLQIWMSMYFDVSLWFFQKMFLGVAIM